MISIMYEPKNPLAPIISPSTGKKLYPIIRHLSVAVTLWSKQDGCWWRWHAPGTSYCCAETAEVVLIAVISRAS